MEDAEDPVLGAAFEEVASGGVHGLAALTDAQLQAQLTVMIGEHETHESLLHWAARFGNVQAVTALLRRGLEADARDSNQATALMWAAFNNHCAVVVPLLEKSASVDATDDDGDNSLMYAAMEGHEAR